MYASPGLERGATEGTETLRQRLIGVVLQGKRSNRLFGTPTNTQGVQTVDTFLKGHLLYVRTRATKPLGRRRLSDSIVYHLLDKSRGMGCFPAGGTALVIEGLDQGFETRRGRS